ncbi:MAG: hypothetical protein RTU92_04585 [Candidatus Thorarchaeota archaeon]
MRKRLILSLFFLGLVLPILVSAATPTDRTGFTPEFDVDVWVDGWSWYTVYVPSLDTGDNIYVEVEVTSGAGIDFFICDQTNYDIWESLGSPYVYQQSQNVGSVSTSFNVPSSGTWYCVFYNDDILTSKHIEGYVGTTPLLAPSLDLLLPLVGLVIAVVCVGVIWFGIKKTQKPKTAHYPTPTPLQQPYTTATQPPASTPTNYCPYCGTPRQSSTASFCATCGRAFEGPGFG